MMLPTPLLSSLRTFSKRPLFAAAVVAILGLGIGSTTAVFTVVHALLLTPLPFPDQERLVRISKSDVQRDWAHYPILFRELELWRETSTSFDAMSALEYTGTYSGVVTLDGAHRSVNLLDVTADYFDVLRVSALYGRTFGPEDDDGGDALNVVLSHRAWQRLYASDPNVLGTTLPVPGNARGYTVVGVLPSGVDYPTNAELYVPKISYSSAGGSEVYVEADVIARLIPGVSVEDARVELATIRSRLTEEDPQQYAEMDVVITPLLETVVGDVRPALMLLFGAVGLVLLIAATNVASLLLVRGSERERELAIRVSVGAGRGRLTGLLLFETVVLAVVGGGIGLVLAHWGLSTLLFLLPDTLPRAETIAVDARVLAFAFIVTIVSALAAGLAPAWKASSQDVVTTLRGGRGVFTAWRTMGALVVVELSLAFVLVVGAWLLGQAFVVQTRIDRGFHATDLTFASLEIPSNEFPVFGATEPRIDLMDRIIERARAIPGVEGATVAQMPPGSADAGVTGPMSVEGQPEDERRRNPMVNIEWVPENYFDTLGMTLLRGRGFFRSDRGEGNRVAIVTESFAEHHWPGEDAVGKRLGSGTRTPFIDVVGVVADVRYRELHKSWLDIYFPAGQTFSGDSEQGYYGGRALIVRSTLDASALAPAIRDAVHAVEPDIHVERIVPLDDLLNADVARPRFHALVLTLFAATGLLLAAVGIYGVMATMTGARRSEVGIRLALGSTPGEAVATILKSGAAISAAGIGLGVVVAAATTRFMTSLLYGIDPLDAWTFAGAATFLGATALLAAYVPARRAARVDPATTLRHD